MTVGRSLSDLAALLGARGLLRATLPGGREGVGSPTEVGIVDVVLDSRRTTPGALFAAVVGERHDGHDFVPAAVAAGAAAVVVERPSAGLAVPQLVVNATRPALAVAAAWYRGFPSRRLGMVGVTGTDGKTTTVHLARGILDAAGLQAGLLGTVDVVVGGVSRGNPARMTTPEAPELQAALGSMIDAGDRWAVVEASSHGLAQDRLGEVAWDVAILTNVSAEHLEFHGTREAYVAAKRRLFGALATGDGNPQKGYGKTGVVNADDSAGASFAAVVSEAGARVLRYGSAADADVRLTSLAADERGLRLGLRTGRWQGDVALPLAGRFNAHNALAAVALGEALALEPGAIRAGLERARPVPGRMERIAAGQPFAVVVDYAHTAEALAEVLDELGALAVAAGGGLIAVFGSGGERDIVKRPAMGREAGVRCRLVVLTDEDPRGEDRMAILEQIAAGAEAAGRQRGTEVLLIPERRAAIAAALSAARRGDVVLCAGKGHEKSIETAEGPLAWDEAAEVRGALAALGWSAAGS